MLGTGQFNGQCTIAAYPGTTSSVGPNCTGFADIFDFPLGGYRFETGTWARVPAANPLSGITALGGTEHVLEASGSSALCVLRPSLRTRGVAGDAVLKAGSGTVVRLYSDLVRTPASSYAEVLLGTSGHLRAHSSRQQRTLALNVTAGDAVRLTTQVCRYTDDAWYLTATVGGISLSVPCDEPRYGRLALGFEGLVGTATVYLLSLAGLGPTVNAAGDESSAEFDACRCGDCSAPDCGCLPAALDVTVAGFANFLGGPCSPASPNGSYTLTGPVSGAYGQWAGGVSVVCSSSFTTISIDLQLHYSGNRTYAIADVNGTMLTGDVAGRGCDKISGLVLSDGGGHALTIGTASE